jgi:hypothetical protein
MVFSSQLKTVSSEIYFGEAFCGKFQGSFQLIEERAQAKFILGKQFVWEVSR